MGKVATEATLKKGVGFLEIIAKNQVTTLDDYKTIQEIVRAGLAADFFNIGDQIMMKWSNGTTEYDCPWDVVHFADVTKSNGQVVPGMFLQCHWGLPGVQFDGNEAFWHCDEALAADTYYFTAKTKYGDNIAANSTWQFTLTQNVPVGGQLVLTTNTSTTGANDPSAWYVRSYESATSYTEIEKVKVTSGNSGTSLGEIDTNTKYSDSGLNNLQRACYGYGRWSQSGIRQWLNSDAAAGEWWKPQNVFDRAPDQLATMRGFKAGLPADFVEIVPSIIVTTALNTISDSTLGTSENTIDQFFLPSLEQEYCVPQLAGVEGEAWEYWIERLGLDTPQKSGSTNALTEHIRYDIANHNTAQHVRLRSANRGTAYSAWNVYSSGYVSSSDATYAHRPCPACVIC